MSSKHATTAATIVGVSILIAALAGLLVVAIGSDHNREQHTIIWLAQHCEGHGGVAQLKLINDGRSGGAAICKDGSVAVK